MKYILTILISLFSLTAIAQPPQESVCMPVEIAKQVAQDLVIGDSAKAMLTVALDELDLTKEKLSFKDSLILNARLKELNLKDQIRICEEQNKNYNLLYEDAKKQYAVLAKKHKRLKAKKTFIEIVGTSIIGGLVYFYITK
jgi:hypothetical protein